jgi:hypothetical protein
MTNNLQARINALRSFRVYARRNIQRAQLSISDDIDRRRFIEVQQAVLRGTEAEWHELHALVGKPLLDRPVRLLPPAQRRLPTVRSTTRRTLDLPTVVVKSLDSEERVLTGWASTRAVDRIGDSVVPEGAQYKLPLPLLLDHEHSQQVEHVIKAKPGKDGLSSARRLPRSMNPARSRRWSTERGIW